jgi:23S rRNA G2069 N7-methylase RlmK/C1962 C5-methylase RlmI
MRAIIPALAVLIATAVPSFAQDVAAPAVPNARVFNGGAGLILYTVKAASTADFDMVLNKTKEALMKSEKPERKQQAASWRVYKSDTPGANGNVTYVMIIDPAIKDADYNIVNILNEAFPAEIQALFKSYTESFASGLIPINLVPVVDYSK